MEIAFEVRPALPAGQPPPQLLVLLHGEGERGAAMRPLAEALQAAFPHAVIVAPEAPRAAADGGPGRHWFEAQPGDDEALGAGVARALPPLVAWVRETQRRLGAASAATAIAGFGQGAVLALELARANDGLCGRVLAFSGRFATLPSHAPRETTLHLFHGAADDETPADHARAALERLGALDGDATLDLAQGVGHRLHPALIDRALFRLRNHIPHRTWRAALGAVPARARPRDAPEADDAPEDGRTNGSGPAPC